MKWEQRRDYHTDSLQPVLNGRHSVLGVSKLFEGTQHQRLKA